MSAKRDSTLNELKRKLAEARAERDEARAQQTATGDVLRAISRSTFDLQSVLDALSETAARLCEAELAFMTRRDGSVYRFVTAVGSTPKTKSDAIRLKETALDRQTFAAGRGSITGRVLAEGRTVQIPDLTADPEYTVGELESIGKIRTLLSVPLMRDEEVIGTMSFGRQRVEPFTDRQIALVNTFAAQAVIAIENARLLNETRERTAELQQSLEYQTATSDVLQVISRSTFDLHPVLQMLVETAARLCETDMAFLLRREGDTYRAGAAVGFSEEYKEYLATHPLPITRGSTTGRVALEKRIIHIPDCMADPEYTHTQSVELAGQRTSLGVPLLREGEVIGVIVLARRRVEPFTEKQIELVSTFADQAVIAMENARLLGDLRDRTDDLQQSLEYQTAISDVLKVISGSGFELAPVFQTVVSTAVRLCRADQATIYRLVDGEYRWAADHSLAPDYERIERNVRIRPGTGTLVGRVASICDTVQILDAWTDPLYEVKDDARVGGVHTMLGVPLLRDGLPIGVIGLARRRIENYNEREIALVRTFADQAVIAIENARLITETREALEQQTATAEVLGVINSSPGDLAPVFEAMLTKALHLCEATFGILWNYDGKEYHATALRNVPQAYMDFLRDPPPADPQTPLGRIAAGEPFAHIHDMAADGLFEDGSALLKQAVDRGGFRTIVGVPLRKDGKLLGAITIYRKEVRRFADKQIALLQNFAAQAVIAIENARLLGETREALEQQTATAEVLGVINSSPGDLAPVFDAMLDNATRLSQAAFGILWTYDGERFQAVAFHDVPQAYVEFLREPQLPSPVAPLGRVARGEAFAHVSDLATDEYREQAGLLVRQGLSLGGFRTVLAVSMRKDASLLGAITIYRREVQPFSDKQIALLENFAAQAVIAMENARLLGDLRERTEDLQQSLEYQTATSDVLKAISRSSFDLQRVLETLAESAAALAQSDTVLIFRREGDVVRLVAQHAPTPAYGAVMGSLTLGADHRSTTGRALMTGEVVRITDVQKEPGYQLPQSVADNVRSTMAVPLLRDGETIGVITLVRLRIEPYTDQQLELVRTFADQAVIAIENTRLLDEVRQRQAELRVTFDNMADGVAMFDHELRLAAWNRNFQELLDLPEELLAERPGFDDYIRYLTERGEFGESEPETEIARLRSRLEDHYSFERTRPDGTVIEVRNNPMPDGGVVFIYSDITERKRSEEEISAARDAAEAAYHDLQAAQANLVQAQKMAALGQLTAGIAHEIKNPLNFVNNFASLSVELLDELKETAAPALAALDEGKRADVDDTMELLTGNLEKIAEHGKRADNIVKSMLEHSRGVSGERREVDLNSVIEEALNLAYHGARAQDQSFNITLERDYAQSLKPIELAPQEMTRVFLNLFGNGFYATTKRARDNGDTSYRPILVVATSDSGDTVEVRVRDNGIGIPPEIRDKLFQPFFTTKPTGEGTGLGLSISYDIVTQQHGGTITVESEPGAYTEFIIRLPRQ